MGEKSTKRKGGSGGGTVQNHILPFAIPVLSTVSTVLALVATFLPFFTLGSGATTTTLWKRNAQSSSLDAEAVLREEHNAVLPCDSGRQNIQAAEGVAVVSCALHAFVFSLALAMMCWPLLLRIVFIVYTALALVANAAVLGIMAHWYVNGWCTTTPSSVVMKDAGWKLSSGFILFIVSAAIDLVVVVLGLATSP